MEALGPASLEVVGAPDSGGQPRCVGKGGLMLFSLQTNVDFLLIIYLRQPIWKIWRK